MTGEVVRKGPHRCELDWGGYGDIWRCDHCGTYWRCVADNSRGGTWHRLGWFGRWFYRVGGAA